MSENQRILRLLRRSFMALPLVLGCMLAAILIARKALTYATYRYEAVARIKLDETSHGISSANLFEDFDVFSGTSRIAAEVELLRSEAILKKVAMRLNSDHSLFRVGQLKDSELDKNRPFTIGYRLDDEKWYDRDVQLQVEENGSYALHAILKGRPATGSGRIGDTLRLDGLDLILEPGMTHTPSGKEMDLAGEYRLRIHSPEHQVARLRNEGLDVTASDEEVPILRIAFQHTSAEHAAEVANAIADTYIEDHISFKTQSAGLTLEFIDAQLDRVGSSLNDSEAALEHYRDDERVINTRQETETNLRKIAQMKIQLANIRMREEALDSLDQYINEGDKSFLELAPSFEAFGDLLFTELLKKLKAYEAEKIDLLVNYTEQSRSVLAVDAKIAETTNYIKESIHNAKKDIVVKRTSIEAAIAESETDFDDLPARERQMVILDREFQLNQKLYLFLMEKRMESAIQESAAMSFHRIIERAQVPTSPVSPKPTFVTIVAGFLGLLIGVGLIALNSFFNVKTRGLEDIEQRSTHPVLGALPWQSATTRKARLALGDVAARMLARSDAKDLRYLAIASQETGAGKTYLARGLAEALVTSGHRVALVDLDLRKEGGEAGIAEAIGKGKKPRSKVSMGRLHFYPAGTSTQHPNAVLHQSAFKDWWEQLAGEHDFVIADTSACEEAAETLSILQGSDLVFWLTRQGKSRHGASLQPDLLAADYGIGPFVHVLNAVSEPKTLTQRIKYLLVRTYTLIANRVTAQKTETLQS